MVVLFGLSGSGRGIFSPIPATDNGDGTYTATFTGTTSGPTTITATIGGNPVISTPANITVTPGLVSLSQSTVTVTPSTIPVGGTATVTLTTRDIYGNPETTGGLTTGCLSTVANAGTLGPLTDNNNGTDSATFSAGMTPSTTTFLATIIGQPVTSTVPILTSFCAVVPQPGHHQQPPYDGPQFLGLFVQCPCGQLPYESTSGSGQWDQGGLD